APLATRNGVEHDMPPTASVTPSPSATAMPVQAHLLHRGHAEANLPGAHWAIAWAERPACGCKRSRAAWRARGPCGFEDRRSA
ncbi:hypothetical protein K3Z93_10205, partial [Pseudomonas aeruginosa]|nr:hypothetical protein [Pseudomonas aeruginosa]